MEIRVSAPQGGDGMKNGKKPTRNQRMFIRSKRLNPENWLVVKDTPTEMVLVHRHFDSNVRKIRKAVRDDG